MSAAAGTARDRQDIELRDIILVCRDGPDSEQLLRILQRTRARVRTFWPPPAVLPDEGDVLVCEASRALAAHLPWLPGEPTRPLVAIADPATDARVLRDLAPDALLCRPFTPEAVQANLALASVQFAYISRLRSRIGKLDETVRSIRVVERAKTMLMAQRSWQEEEAYRFIRTQAMVHRVSLGAMAASIVEGTAAEPGQP